MKNNIFLPFFLFLVLIISSCVSKQPQYATIQDGVRCPLPQNIASNSNPSKRAPVSEAVKPSEQVCDQLFGSSNR